MYQKTFNFQSEYLTNNQLGSNTHIFAAETLWAEPDHRSYMYTPKNRNNFQ